MLMSIAKIGDNSDMNNACSIWLAYIANIAIFNPCFHPI